MTSTHRLFKKGDRVTPTRDKFKIRGPRTVLEDERYVKGECYVCYVKVEHDENHRLHDCCQLGKNGHCWNYKPEDLKLIDTVKTLLNTKEIEME